MMPATGPSSRVADQPAEYVTAEGRHQLPRHHGEAEETRDQAAGAEADELRREVGEVVRRLTTLAPMFTFSVAIRMLISARKCDQRLMERPSSVIGLQIGSPKTTVEAEVHRDPDEAVVASSPPASRTPGRRSASPATSRSG
jgi:hypothetical protein